jgi:hypothetical protein
VIFLVFLELSFFIEKQFLNHPTLRRIGRDFEHGPEMLNVLPYEKRSAKGLRRRRRVGFEQINAPLCRLDDRFPMEKVAKWQPIATHELCHHGRRPRRHADHGGGAQTGNQLVPLTTPHAG